MWLLIKIKIMKKLLLLIPVLLLFSCAADDGSVTQEEVTLLVNHYKTTSRFFLANNYLVQENENIGSNHFFEVHEIIGFTPTPAIIYEITATKFTIKNPGTSATTNEYELIDILSETPVSAFTFFNIPLNRYDHFGNSVVSWVTGTDELGYFISNEIEIDCRKLCPYFKSLLFEQAVITGVFEHGQNGEYILKELLKY